MNIEFNWTPSGDKIQKDYFKDITPVDVLYDFDGPMIFTFKNNESLHLAYMSGKTNTLSRFTVSPTNNKIIKRLITGEISIREAIVQPWLWCIDIDGSGQIENCWITSPDELPQNIIPRNGVMIDPKFETVFSVRVDGTHLSRNNVPASAIKRAVDGAYNALKKISEEITGGINSGRPSKEWKQVFDLPAKEVRLGSFEISFQEPNTQQNLLLDENTLQDNLWEQGKIFSDALDWATDGSANEPRLPFLEAMEKLIPPQTGLIETVYIGGRLVKGKKKEYLLNRRATKKVREALSRARIVEEKTFPLSGYPREFDKDRLSFRLRANEIDYTCLFQEELYDDIMEIFTSDEMINVMLTVKSNSTSGEVIAIARNTDQKIIQNEQLDHKE